MTKGKIKLQSLQTDMNYISGEWQSFFGSRFFAFMLRPQSQEVTQVPVRNAISITFLVPYTAFLRVQRFLSCRINNDGKVHGLSSLLVQKNSHRTMPWLSRQNSADEGVKPVDGYPKSSQVKSSVKVNFIPAQIDGLCGTFPAHHKQAPSQLLFRDLGVIGQNLRCLPAMAMSMLSKKALRNHFGKSIDARDTLIQILLAVAQVWMAAVALPAFLLLPGLMFVSCVAACWLFTTALTWPLYGSAVVMSDLKETPISQVLADERWIYVNGMMCRYALHYNPAC